MDRDGNEISTEFSNAIIKTLTLYRDAVQRHEKLYLYDHSQPAGPDLGWDRMVDWASETDQAFVAHVKQLHFQLADLSELIDELIDDVGILFGGDPWPSIGTWTNFVDKYQKIKGA